jgi:hypothetical protein
MLIILAMFASGASFGIWFFIPRIFGWKPAALLALCRVRCDSFDIIRLAHVPASTVDHFNTGHDSIPHQFLAKRSNLPGSAVCRYAHYALGRGLEFSGSNSCLVQCGSRRAARSSGKSHQSCAQLQHLARSEIGKHSQSQRQSQRCRRGIGITEAQCAQPLSLQILICAFSVVALVYSGTKKASRCCESVMVETGR